MKTIVNLPSPRTVITEKVLPLEIAHELYKENLLREALNGCEIISIDNIFEGSDLYMKNGKILFVHWKKNFCLYSYHDFALKMWEIYREGELINSFSSRHNIVIEFFRKEFGIGLMEFSFLYSTDLLKIENKLKSFSYKLKMFLFGKK